jgi:hypothetical protein
MQPRRVHRTLSNGRKLVRLFFGAMLITSLPVVCARAEITSTTARNGDCERPGRLALAPDPAWGDIGGWDQPQYYATIQLADIDGDGRAELIGRGPGGILVNHFDTATETWVAKHAGPPLSDVAHWDQPQYYTTIKFADIDGDGQAELVARGPDGIQVWHYDSQADCWKELASSGPFSDSGDWGDAQYYTTIHLADVDGDGRAELVGRASDGLHVYRYEKNSHRWSELPPITDLSDAGGWDQAKYYSTIHLADVDGRPGAELVARGPDGIHVYHYENESGSWIPLPTLTELSDANGWDRPQYNSSIQLADVDGRPGTELIARGPDGVHVYHYGKESGNWMPLPTLTELNDANGWDQPQYNSTIQLADVDGRPGTELIARGSEGIRVWHYNPKAECWTRLGTMRPEIASMSDANGWNLPQHYLTIQAGDIDGQRGAGLIGRSATGIETWRFKSTNRTAREATGTPGFPPFTGVQNTYYQYISAKLGNGSNIRANYDQLGSDVISTLLSSLSSLSPPSGVLPADDNWKAVKTQVQTELTYVQTANDWVLGVRGSQTLVTQIFTEVGLDADSVAAKLSNVNRSTVIAADLFSLLTKIAQGVASAAGVPVAPGVASLLSTIFSEVYGNGGAPNLSVAVGEVKGKLATMYNSALNANNDTHEALVTNWSKLQAFAASKVGTAPNDNDLKQMRLAGELSYAAWLWETISPAVWHVVIPYYDVHKINNTCEYVEQLDYPSDGPTYAFDSGGCGPAWIGVDCGYFSCDSVTEPAVVTPFGGSCPGGVDCRDPVNGPLLLNRVDLFLGRNGWNLPCFDQNDTCTLTLQNAAFDADRARKARHAINSLLSLVKATVSDQETQISLTEPLEAALAVFKQNGGPTQRDFTMNALQNFALQAQAEARCQLGARNTASLVEAAYDIRGQLTDNPPLAVLYSRHGH